MDLQREKEATEKMELVLKSVKDRLISKKATLEKRYDYMKSLDLEQYIPLEPSRNLETTPEFVETEKEIILNELMTSINTIDGQIQGQDEMIYQNSEACKKAEEDYNQLQNQLADLVAENLQLKERLKDGEE